jgi:hypothetical protein
MAASPPVTPVWGAVSGLCSKKLTPVDGPYIRKNKQKSEAEEICPIKNK